MSSSSHRGGPIKRRKVPLIETGQLLPRKNCVQSTSASAPEESRTVIAFPLEALPMGRLAATMTTENRDNTNNERQVLLNSIKLRVQEKVGGMWIDGRWTEFVEEMAWYLHASGREETDITDSLVGLITYGIQSENNLIAIADSKKEFREALSTRKEIMLPAICDALYHKYVVAALQQQGGELSFAHLPTHTVSFVSTEEHASQDPSSNTLHDSALSENEACHSMVPPISFKGESEVDAAGDKMSSPPPPSSESAARGDKSKLPVIEIGHLLARQNNLHNTTACTQEESMIVTTSPMEPLHVDCVPVIPTDQTESGDKNDLDEDEDPEHNADHTYLSTISHPTTLLSLGGMSVTLANRNSGNINEAKSITGSLFQQGDTGGGSVRLLNERCNVGDEVILVIPRTSLPGSQNSRFDVNLIPAPADYDGSMMHDDDENGVGFELANDHEPTEGFGTVDRKPSVVQQAEKVETNKNYPWALLDPHDMRPTKARPLRIGVTYRLPEGLDEPPPKATTETHTRRQEPMDRAAPSVVSVATENFRATDANRRPQRPATSQALGRDISKNTNRTSDSPEAGALFDTEDATIAESRKSEQQSINLRTTIALAMEYPIRSFLRNADAIPHNDDTVSTYSRQQQSTVSQPAWNAALVKQLVGWNKRARLTRDEEHTDYSPRQKMKRTKIESSRGRVLSWMSQTAESTDIGMDIPDMAAASEASFPLPHDSITNYHPQASQYEHPLHGRHSHYDSGPLPCHGSVLYPSTLYRHIGPTALSADFSARQIMEQVWPPAYQSASDCRLVRRAPRAAPPNDSGMHAPYVPTFSQPRVLPTSTSHGYHHRRHGGYEHPHSEHRQSFTSRRSHDHIPTAPSPHQHNHHQDAREHGVGTHPKVSSAKRCVPLDETSLATRKGTTPNHVETHSIPGLEQLVNYPNFLSKFTYSTRQRERHCVMCGELRPYSSARVRTLPSTLAYTPEKESELAHFIPARNKNVCTACDEIVWRVVECNLDIKFCRLCYNFCPVDAFFGDARSKGRGRKMTKTCINCRRLKYWRLKWVAAATRKP